MQNRKLKEKNKGRPRTEHQQRHQKETKRSTRIGAEKHLWETACPRQNLPISAVLVAVCALKKLNAIKEHKRSTRETRGFAKTEHQQVQSESTNEAPESTIRDHKKSTRETSGFAKTEHQQVQSGSRHEIPESVIRDHKKNTREIRGYQRFCQNEAPASPIRKHQ